MMRIMRTGALFPLPPYSKGRYGKRDEKPN